MREYKFRGKPFEDVDFDEIDVHISKDDFVYGNLIQDGNTSYIVNGIVESTEDYLQLEQWIRVRPETVGQFTGLLDKNGKEIYEGDLIRYTDKKKWYGTTVFELYLTGMSFAEIDYEIEQKPYHKTIVEMPNVYEVTEINEYEIIGNIHDKGEHND